MLTPNLIGRQREIVEVFLKKRLGLYAPPAHR